MYKAGGNQLCSLLMDDYEYVITKLVIASFGSILEKYVWRILSITFSTKLAAASFMLM